ncbi:MAG TPA: (2Fe-2S) ferredoxin domain-containing protein [Hydrogenispora sp.]|jgi:NADH:ubiquinone oxidoreductase subunit E|nr:(2Fe-2S) ferredoxin domain-containing protein [Hydrogenispora sp.]
MKTLSVCVGSSCHLLGSYEVIRELQQLLERHGLTDRVELKASFCLGHCQAGVTVCYDGVVHTALTKEKIGAFFDKYILEL